VVDYSVRKATLSFLLAALTSLLSLLLPLYGGQSTLQHPGKASALEARPETLPSINGPMIYYELAIPVIVAGLPLLLRFRAVRLVCAALLTGWVVIGAASIGMFYLPSATMMVLAASESSA
jgi:hypothetical protein